MNEKSRQMLIEGFAEICAIRAKHRVTAVRAPQANLDSKPISAFVSASITVIGHK